MRGKSLLLGILFVLSLGLLGATAQSVLVLPGFEPGEEKADARSSERAERGAAAQVAYSVAPRVSRSPAQIRLAASTTLLEDSPVGGAAEALRRGDCDRALELVGAMARRQGEGPEPPSVAHLLYGFYAHACERVDLAERELLAAEPSTPGGEAAASEQQLLALLLEDWRLMVLADSAMALDRPRVAAGALERLLTRYPDSPLVPRALSRVAEATWSAEDPGASWAWIDEGRRRFAEDGLAGDEAPLDVLAWRLAQESGDLERQRSAARRLLWMAPIEASKLQVIDLFRSSEGALDWLSVLTPEQLIDRAEHLLAARLAPNAQQTLDEVPLAARSARWALLSAEALTAQNRGAEALAALAGIDSETARAQAARIEWLRGRAKADLAVVRSGEPGPPAARRAQLKTEAQAHWRRVVELESGGAPTHLTRSALRSLYTALDDEERFDDALVLLRRLLELDPDDETGLTILWKRGWQQFAQHNHTGAIGYWSELRSVYPHTRTARIAQYWTGRAYEALGQRDRSQAIYRLIVAADVTDFYARHARVRLPAGEAVAVASPAPVQWPRDPSLDRAHLLTDAGLDDLALTELDSLGLESDRKASAALRARVLARKGERRPSVDSVIRAFPQLGWANQTAVPAEALSLYYPVDFSDSLLEAARRYGLDPYLVLGIVRQESAFDSRAVSRSGARGLMQLMPPTGREVAGKLGMRYSNARLWEPDFNLRLGTSYFHQLLRMFDGDVELALAGYNGGPNRIRRLWREAGHTERDRFIEGLYLAESRRYVKRIVLLSDSYRRLYPDLEARAASTLGP